MELKLLPLIFLMAFLSVPLIHANQAKKDFRYCSDRKYQVTLTGVRVSLVPVRDGKRISFDLSAYTVLVTVGSTSSLDELLDERLDFVKSIQRFIQATCTPNCNKTCYPFALHLATSSFVTPIQLDQAIFGGEMVIDLSFYGVHFHSEKYNLCDGISCPISSGEFPLSLSQVLPVDVSPGTYTFKMNLLSEDRRPLSCFAFNFTMPYPQLVSDL